jgi:RsiW-degrading membrane proteinase PrsW (M82 family)
MLNFQFIYQRWLQIFVGGAALFFATEQVLKFTGNPNFFPTVILLGAFVVPVAFVAYFYGQERVMDKEMHREAPLVLVSLTILLGGTLGLIVAGLIEYGTLKNLTIPGLFAVGLIEEAAKLLFPLAIYLRGRYRSEADGLLFGIASGMGFAALETMGYGLVALIQSQGNVGILEEVLLIRGLLSPVGHAAWTGLICAVLWRGRKRSGRLFNPSVIGVFALAVVLHALWDISGSATLAVITYVGYVAIGAISLTLLIRALGQSRREALTSAGKT